MPRKKPILHRDDPAREPLGGHVKVTREDWLNVARNILVHDGVANVKILSLSEQMGVSRSSFYWYFDNRNALLEALLNEWENRNTSSITMQCALHAETIAEAVFNFFKCFLDPTKFDAGLDFAIREWARRNEDLRKRVDTADRTRLDSIIKMFLYHGYENADADARARILYFMQLGYHALDVREPMNERLKRIEPYIVGFTGSEPDEKPLKDFLSYLNRLGIT